MRSRHRSRYRPDGVRSGAGPAVTVTHLLRVCAGTVMAVWLPACASSQPPPRIPDQSGLRDVTPDFLGHTPRDAGSFRFSGDAGGGHSFTCDGARGGAGCEGILPGLDNIPIKAATLGDCDRGDVAIGTPIRHYKGVCEGPAGLGPHPGEKVSLGSVTCGVFPGGITECTDGSHGFVLQPSGSFNF